MKDRIMSRLARVDGAKARDWSKIAAILAAIGVVLYLFHLQGAQIAALDAALGDEQANAEDHGIEPVAPPAEELLDDPNYSGPQGPQGEPGPGPSDAQVYAAVADYLAAHPVTADGPSSAQIAAAVAAYLSDYPPGPTPEQVSAAVAAYLTEHPPAAGADGADGTNGVDGSPGPTGPAGPTGPQGEAGPPPSAEEVAAAVEAFMRDNPLPARCPDGYEFTAATLVTLSGPPLESVVCAEV
jgi:hypothetical protein